MPKKKRTKKTKKKSNLPPKNKTEKKKVTFWWDKVKEKETQEYDPSFFNKHFAKLEPTLPDDYKDEIYEEECKYLYKPHPDYPDNPDMKITDLPALLKFYDKEVIPQFKDKVVGICMCHGGDTMKANSGVSLSALHKPKHRIHTNSGHNIDCLRNSLTDIALHNEDCSHIFFIDADVVLPPYALIRMLRRNVDVVTGIYTMKVPPYVPLAIQRPERPDGSRLYNYYINLNNNLMNKFFRIDAMGAGCMLIKREVLVEMGPPWFKFVHREHGMSSIGEDIFFFDRIKKHGFELWLDTTIQCDHINGNVAYPQVFYSQAAHVGQFSQHMVYTWNRNAVLWSLGLPFVKDPPPKIPQQKKTLEDVNTVESVKEPIAPMDVDIIETGGDMRRKEVKKL